MKHMAFSATIPQMINGTKTVTRRAPGTWASLVPGDRLVAVHKMMGMAKGEKRIPLAIIEIVDNRVEQLHHALADGEPQAEGFEIEEQFVAVWKAMHGQWEGSSPVRRIQFRHVTDLVWAETRASAPDIERSCPLRHMHTDRPDGYIARYEWAENMMAEGNRQIECPGCGLWTVWIPKKFLT